MTNRRSRTPLRGRRCVGAVALAVLCAACTSGGDGGPEPEPSAGKVRVLRVATASDVSQGPVRQALIDAWDRKERDVRVEIVELPSSSDDARSQLVAALQSGSADYDVVNIDVVHTAEFAAGDLIRPLDDSLLRGMWDQVKKTARYDGRTWAVPFNTDAGLLYYRTDIWKDEHWHPPVTWAELESYAEDARKPSQVEQTFEHGFATQLDRYEGLTVNAQESVWAEGGELLDDHGTVRAGTPETQDGLNELVDRYEKFMPPETRSADERDSLEMFRDGKVPFMRNWPYVYNVLSAEGSKVRGKFGVAPLPGRLGVREKSVLGGQNLAIAAGSAHPDDAERLLRYLVRPEQQRCMLTAGFAPVLRASYDPGGPSCSLPDAQSPGAGGEDGDGRGKAGPGGEKADSAGQDGDELPVYTGTLKEALSAARSRPVTPYYAAFTELVQTKVHQMIEDRGDSGSVAAALHRELSDVVKGH